MHHRIKIGLAAATIAALGLVAAGSSGMFTAAAQTEGFSDGQVKSIEKIVKDYLLNHPEVLQEAQEALEHKAEQARVDATRAHLPAFYKSLAALDSDIAAMSVGKGDVTVVEFFDYNCGYCRKTLADLVKLMETDPNIKVQFMEYPILAPESKDAARVAIAAAKQGKYFEFHKAMFSAGRASKESALKVAEQIGLDMTRLKADLAAPETDALLSRISDAGKRMFIDGTPTFIVGDKVNPGWTQFEQLKEFVSEACKGGCKSCAAAGSAKDDKKS
jgi:protein-disulfide isomerase